MYLKDVEDWAATMAAICAALTGGVQMAAGMYAARAIAGALKERSDLLADTSGLDQEVGGGGRGAAALFFVFSPLPPFRPRCEEFRVSVAAVGGTRGVFAERTDPHPH